MIIKYEPLLLRVGRTKGYGGVLPECAFNAESKHARKRGGSGKQSTTMLDHRHAATDVTCQTGTNRVSFPR